MSIMKQVREFIDTRHTWDLRDLYPSNASWEADVVRVKNAVTQFSWFKGRVGGSLESLAACMQSRFSILETYSTVMAYASLLYHQDMRDLSSQAMHDRAALLGMEIESAMSFVEPEILAMPIGSLDEFIRSPSLADYAVYLRTVLRRRVHVRSPEVEALVASTGELASGYARAYQALFGVNIAYPTVRLSTNEVVQIDPSAYSRLRHRPSRRDREAVFQAFWSAIKSYRETFAYLLAGKLSADRFLAEAQGYPGDLERALDLSDVPSQVYHNMISEVRRATPLLHRYLELRRRALSLPKLAYHDMYVPIAFDVPFHVSYDDGVDIIRQAMRPLGADYARILEQAIAERWVDVYPSPGKRSGAYSSGSHYRGHPYVLLNYVDDFASLCVTAHELGHAIHSHMSNANQPFPTSDYAIFAAEVASTLNEHLLLLHLLQREGNPQRRLFLLGQVLDSFKSTVFRQAFFAEFELAMHDATRQGKPTTADSLDDIYLTLAREYFGEKEGIMTFDSLYAIEWAYITHFYLNFYVFQYVTAFIAAASIARNIFTGDTVARDSYLRMLKAGSSCPPLELVKIAGADLSSPAPYRAAMHMMEEVLNLVETQLQSPRHLSYSSSQSPLSA